MLVKKLILSTLVAVVFLMACKKETPAANYANAADCSSLIDTVNTYAKSTSNIINTNCKSCHRSSNKKGGINLEDYASAKSVFQNGSGLCSVHKGSGCSPMPEGGSLSSSDIQKLDCWVNNGCKQ